MRHEETPEGIREGREVEGNFPLKCGCGSINLRLDNGGENLKKTLDAYILPFKCLECGDSLYFDLAAYYLFK